MSEITELIEYFQESGGIPIVNTVNPMQFGISIAIALIGSFFIFFMMFNLFKPKIISAYYRIKLGKIVKESGKPMIVIKHTTEEMFGISMINRDTLLKLVSHLNELGGRGFDLVLHTPGGEIFAATYISRLLKEYPGKINAIIPFYAMSGGTLLTLSCDKIFMNSTSCLGPVDPQLGNLFKFGSAKAWSKIIKMKGKKAEDSSISFDLMGKQYTDSVSTHMRYLLDGTLTKTNQNKFIKYLTSGEVEHGRNIIPKDLESFGFNLNPIPDNFNKIFHQVLGSQSKDGVFFIDNKRKRWFRK